MQQKMEAVKGELTMMKGKLTKMEGKMNARESSVEQRENEIAEREEKLAAKQRDLEEWKEEASSRLREDRVIVNQVSFFSSIPPLDTTMLTSVSFQILQNKTEAATNLAAAAARSVRDSKAAAARSVQDSKREADRRVQDSKREADRRVRAERSLASTKVEKARMAATKQIVRRDAAFDALQAETRRERTELMLSRVTEQRTREEQMKEIGEGLKQAFVDYESTIEDLQLKNKQGQNDFDAVHNRLRTAERNTAGRLTKMKAANQATNQLKDAWEEQTDEVSRLKSRIDELQEENKADKNVITELRAEITVSIHCGVFFWLVQRLDCSPFFCRNAPLVI